LARVIAEKSPPGNFSYTIKKEEAGFYTSTLL